ncbi:unnamed protein product [Aphanomyces euteiches]
MAYLTEPIPGGVAPMPPLTWNTFEEYVNTTVSHFQRVFNNDTLKPGQFSTRDLCTNSYGMRHDMAMPFEIAEHDVVDYLIRMPAAMFFGQGMRTFAVNFLTSNATRRMEFQPWQWCQHDLVLTIPIGDFCVWIEETKPHEYTVWGAASAMEELLSPLPCPFVKFTTHWDCPRTLSSDYCSVRTNVSPPLTLSPYSSLDYE